MESRRVGQAHVDERDRPLLSALQSALAPGSSLQAELRDRFERRRAGWGKPDAEFDFSEARRGSMIRFSELFPESDSMLLKHDGVRYLVDDDWCGQPSCTCQAGMVHFYRVLDAAEGAAPDDALRTEYAGTTPYPLGTEETLPPSQKPPPRELVELLSDAEVARALKDRQKALRDAARPHLLPRTPQVQSIKVGRNDACPCGSGKKFKKCCQGLGARAPLSG